MKLFIRPVDLDLDKAELLSLLHRNLADLDHEARFQWLYHDNPAGRAWSWFVCDDSSERAIGAATVFPRFFWVEGREVRVGQVADFAVDAAYRSLGPAIRLQRATLSLVDEGVLKYCYDCPPHDRGMATFQRLGITPLCQMARFTRLTRVDNIVKRVPGGAVLEAPLKLVGNALLRIRNRARRRVKEIELDKHEGAFGEEFDELERGLMRDRGLVRSRRMAQDLNWRYRSDPLRDFQVVTARRANELVGFAVFSEKSDSMNLIDLVASSESEQAALFEAVSNEAFREGKTSVHTWFMDSSPDATTARKLGFWPRGAGDRVVVYPPPQDVDREGSLAETWSLGRVDTIA